MEYKPTGLFNAGVRLLKVNIGLTNPIKKIASTFYYSKSRDIIIKINLTLNLNNEKIFFTSYTYCTFIKSKAMDTSHLLPLGLWQKLLYLLANICI